jgi:hypothetical protein
VSQPRGLLCTALCIDVVSLLTDHSETSFGKVRKDVRRVRRAPVTLCFYYNLVLPQGVPLPDVALDMHAAKYTEQIEQRRSAQLRFHAGNNLKAKNTTSADDSAGSTPIADVDGESGIAAATVGPRTIGHGVSLLNHRN